MKLELRKLELKDKRNFEKSIIDWKENIQSFVFDYKEINDFESLINKFEKEEKGLDLPDGYVPSTTLYAFLEDKIIGRVSIRHTLTRELSETLGNIGFIIHPDFRGNGYGYQILDETIKYCKKLNINEVLLTCSDLNKNSYKIIEKCKGILIDKIWDDQDKEVIRRYIIKNY